MTFDYDLIFRSVLQTKLLTVLCLTVLFIFALIGLIKIKCKHTHPLFCFYITVCLIFLLFVPVTANSVMQHGIFLFSEKPSDAVEYSGCVTFIDPSEPVYRDKTLYHE